MKILLSWEAFGNDYERETNKANPQGPTLSFHQYFYESNGYDQHILLSARGKQGDQKQVQLLKDTILYVYEGRKVELRFIPIEDIVDMNEVRRKVASLLEELKEHELHFFISPGTSAMQVAWHLIHIERTDLNTTLLQTVGARDTADGKPKLKFIELEKSTTPGTLIAKEQEEKTASYYKVGESLITPSIEKVYSLARKAAAAEQVTVLISGATGSGKENLASYIHESSSRKGKAFIAVNCSAFDDNLLLSQLFGYKKGAFTGATEDRKGLFKEADGGTIFLDEIGDISSFTQQALLRVLQSGEFLPIGSAKTEKVNVRVITATHRNLRELCVKEKFRWDLFYRISTAELKLPSLQERGQEEINTYLDYMIEHEGKQLGKKYQLKLSKKVKEYLLAYPYPGNLREMRNIITTLYVFEEGKEVDSLEFLPEIPEDVHSNSLNHDEYLAPYHKQLLIRLMKHTNGNLSKATKLYGKVKNTLVKDLEKHGVDVEEFR